MLRLKKIMGRTVFLISLENNYVINVYNIGYDLNESWKFCCCGSLIPVFGVKSLGDVSPYMRSYYF